MSRHRFSKVLTDERTGDDRLIDRLGHSLAEWREHGVIGHDRPLGTYFFNLEGSWIFGTMPREITTIGELQAVIGAIFPGRAVPFDPGGLREIAQGVEDTPHVLHGAEVAARASAITEEYLSRQIDMARMFEEESNAV
ncbi:MAG: hypothetical protein CL484_14260 [Acidobacteria bacterium]|jgi:hypothetical protein|uniref:hypothetical protein n=1 Tax=Halomonas sp. PA16-9 TaxID=2576841 RepID=UPI000C8F748D|nr:hypothetical protein [Acidobacteriota bacterium]QGQ72597.1 hypothetical protein FDY98_25655 [Halomonas sp. PA16-9]|tara:strand:+ start:7082 stop:7495 length:414 start_codon:yes stop_codon:yes gene_type:complete